MIDPQDFRNVVYLLDRQEKVSDIENLEYLSDLELAVDIIMLEQQNRKRGYS